MSFWNSDSIYGDMMGDIENQIQRVRGKSPLQLGDLDTRTRGVYDEINKIGLNNLLAGLSRATSQAGRTASAQGASMNLANPYAYVNRARAGATDAFAPMFGNLNQAIVERRGQAMMQNPLTADASQQAQWQALAQLLGMKSQVGMARGENEFNIHDLLPGLIQGAGAMFAGGL